VDLARIAALEADWLTRLPRVRAHLEFYGWEPYDLGEFTRLLDAAIPHAARRSFLDAGCGIGTKCLAAASRGLTAEGVELVPAYAARTRRLGVTVHKADVRGWPHYADYGIVYVNCPLKGEAAEARFERWLHGQMAPGAVLISVNDCAAPRGWGAVLDERAQFRGVYVKPGG